MPESVSLRRVANHKRVRISALNEERIAHVPLGGGRIDLHGMDILTRAGHSKNVMVNMLTWLAQTEGASSGGILATIRGLRIGSAR